MMGRRRGLHVSSTDLVGGPELPFLQHAWPILLAIVAEFAAAQFIARNVILVVFQPESAQHRGW